VFFDSSHHTLDAKGRVFVPKRFQQALARDEEGNLTAFLTLGLDGCLFLFPEDGFQEALARMDTAAFTGKDQRNMQRLFFSVTQQVTLDASGRLLIPDKLRQKVGLGKEVVMVGVARRIEIWPKERWEHFLTEHEPSYDQLDEVLCEPPGDGARKRDGRDG
jgi:MraZ protein